MLTKSCARLFFRYIYKFLGMLVVVFRF